MRQEPRSRNAALTVLETYLQEISLTPLLGAEEERALAERISQGDPVARDHMVRANLRLVVTIARHFTGRGLELPDLIAEGNLGLLRAVEAFDPALNTRFSTYASFWIKQSIQRALDNQSRPVRLPAYMLDLLTAWRRTTRALEEELGRAPAQEEVARRLNLSPKKLALVRKAIRIASAALQGDAVESGQALDQLFQDERSASPEAPLTQEEEVGQVLRELSQLEEREATVLRLRFGLDGAEPHSLQDIGERLGLTRERVRQIERQALDKLSARLQPE